tara:strand:+ start:4124 stop:4231 length:108 start_codon:yes stop_codon:yes gene_type:complete
MIWIILTASALIAITAYTRVHLRRARLKLAEAEND